jgi:hypothetical protein
MTDAERELSEQAAKDFSAQVGLEYFDTRPRLDINPLVGKLTLEGMQAYGVVPIGLHGNKLTLGVSEQTNRELLEPLRTRLAGYDVSFKFVSSAGWTRLFNRYRLAGDADLLESGKFDELGHKLDQLEPKFMFEPLVHSIPS